MSICFISLGAIFKLPVFNWLQSQMNLSTSKDFCVHLNLKSTSIDFCVHLSLKSMKLMSKTSHKPNQNQENSKTYSF